MLVDTRRQSRYGLWTLEDMVDFLEAVEVRYFAFVMVITFGSIGR